MPKMKMKYYLVVEETFTGKGTLVLKPIYNTDNLEKAKAFAFSEHLSAATGEYRRGRFLIVEVLKVYS